MPIRFERDPLSESVIGAAMEVHSIIGPGYFESQYEEALARELQLRDILFERQKIVPLTYKGLAIGEYRLDFLVDGQLVVELKAVDCLAPVHTAQVLAYLKATKLRIGLLINFNAASLRNGLKRIVLDK
ncbi:MAG: GxxExxY protein [Sporomusaceae bacterium]|nr:GxxExxY protein [Sporomusaceae bacterium]